VDRKEQLHEDDVFIHFCVFQGYTSTATCAGGKQLASLWKIWTAGNLISRPSAHETHVLWKKSALNGEQVKPKRNN